MVSLTVEVLNIDETLAALASLGAKIVPLVAMAAMHEAEYELPLTRDRVPIDTGELRLSGRVEGPHMEGGVTATADIAYGGPPGSGGLNDVDVNYAIIVHEDLSARHPIGQAKYVESVVREEIASGRASKRMGAEINAGLDRVAAGLTGPYAHRTGMYLRGGTGGRFIGSTPNL
jgi:hypothetical protein